MKRRTLLAATALCAVTAVAASRPAAALDIVSDPGHTAATVQGWILQFVNMVKSLANEARQIANQEVQLANDVRKILHLYHTLQAVTGGNIYAIRSLLPELAEAGLIDPLDADWTSLQELLVSGTNVVFDASALAGQVRSLMGNWAVWTPPGRGFGAAATRQASAVWSGHYVAGKTLSEAAGKRSKHVADLMQAGAGAATIKQSMDHAARLAGENVVATQQATQAVALVAQGQARREMQEMQERQAMQASAFNLAARAQEAYDDAAAGRVVFKHGPTYQLVSLAADSSAFQLSSVSAADSTSATIATDVTTSPTGTRLTTSTYGAESTSALDTMARNMGEGAVQAARDQGVNPNATAAVCMAESGCRNLGAHSSDPKMTASGGFGYTNGTFNATAAASGIDTSAGKNDGAVQAGLASYDLKQAAQTLQSAGISDPTALDAYGAHMFGAGNAVNLATAPGDAQLSSVLRGTSAATLAANKLTGATVGQWRQNVSARMGGAADVPVLTQSI